jgi:hypothetical protein
MRSFPVLLLAAGLLALALRPLLVTGGEPQQHLGGVTVAPLPVHHPHTDHPVPKPRRKPGRTIEQILNNPLDR